MSEEPVFHQLEPFRTTALQVISKLAGRFCVIALFTACELQLASRLESLPQQPKVLEPQMGVLGMRSTQMFTKFL